MAYQTSYSYGPGQTTYGQGQQGGTQVIIANQPAAQPMPPGQIQNVRQWSSGLCGCFEDCGSCCCAFWCFPCFMCQTATQMGECMCGPCCCGGGYKAAGLHLHTCPPNMFTVAMRTKLRTKYGIEGTICDDICCIWCCELCTATQMYRELKHQGALFK